MHNKTTTMINYSTIFNGKWKVFCAILALVCGNSAFGMDYNEKELLENPWEDEQTHSTDIDYSESESSENPWKDMKSQSTNNPKPLPRFERQKLQLQQLTKKFEQNEEGKKAFRKSDSNLDNSSQRVKKMVEQIEQRSKIEEKHSYSKFKQTKRPPFGIEVNHKPANLVLEKKDKPLFDKKNIRPTENNSANTNVDPDAMDWEPTPSISDLEQKEIQVLNQKLEEANKVIDELKQQLETANFQIRTYEKQINEHVSNPQKSDTIKHEGENSSHIRNLLDRTNNPDECEKLVRDGTFASILEKHSDSYNKTLKNVIVDQLKQKDGIVTDVGNATVLGGKIIEERSLSFRSVIAYNEDLFKDPSFVIKLKPGFTKASKLYENDKNSERWIPFAIVENLKRTFEVIQANTTPLAQSPQSQLLESIRKGKISQQEYERLVRDGTFFSILSLHIHSYPSRVQSAIADKVEERQTSSSSSSDGIFHSKLPAEIIRDNSSLFRDPEFVRRLKPAFAEHFFNSDKESNERIIPFLIVKNLNSTTSVSFATPKPNNPNSAKPSNFKTLKTEDKPASSGFSFATSKPNNPNSAKPSNFNFKTLKTEDKPAPSGFSFATPKPNNPNSAENTDFSFGNSNHTTEYPVSFNSNKIQYYNPTNAHFGTAQANKTNSAQSPQNKLFEAIEKGNLIDVSNAVKNGANINEQDKNGNTPLNKASQNGHLEIVKFLIKYGADVNKSGNDGWTPLHTASYNGNLEIVMFLVKNGADINRITTISGRTPLYIAKFNKHQNIVNYLKSKGAK